MGKRKKKRQEGEQQPSQQFDTTFKDWIRKSAAEILPLFLADAVYEGALDVEIIKPTMRTDRVFRVTFTDRGEVNIIDVEFQVALDPRLASRLLVYNAVLHHEYQVPVISIVIYPFKTTKAGSPLVITSGKKLITFDFVEIALYEENAQDYVDEHIFAMYPMLPTMQNVDHILLQRAMDELEKHLHGQEGSFAEQFVWMELVLDRTETISLPEKERIKEALQVYDALWESHPKVKKLRSEIAASKAQGKAEGRAEGKAEGKAEGRIEGRSEGELREAQRMLVSVVKVRFPALAELAEQEAAKITNAGALELLVQKVVAAPNEDIARWLLSPPVA